MNVYEQIAIGEVEKWKKEMRKRPSIVDKVSKGVQNKFNAILPEKYHEIMTMAIKNMTQSVLFGYKYVTKKPYLNLSLKEREDLVREKTILYKNTAMIEGAGTGAGGIALGIADFPLLLSIKIKMLYDIAAIYGFDVKNYKERLYILYIFQLAFSSKNHVNMTFYAIENWKDYSEILPDDINFFDWKTFQQEYRDYIDLAKLMQMIPGIGAFVGAYVNNKLIDKLSKTAINAYRMRVLNLYK